MSKARGRMAKRNRHRKGTNLSAGAGLVNELDRTLHREVVGVWFGEVGG
jgi:hypothetical protein